MSQIILQYIPKLIQAYTQSLDVDQNLMSACIDADIIIFIVAQQHQYPKLLTSHSTYIYNVSKINY